MTADDMMPLLRRWLERFRAIESVQQTLYGLAGATPESPLLEAMYRCHEAYTETLASVIGDTESWLEWFLFENDSGQKGMSVRLSDDTREREITSLRDLAEMLEAVQ